MTNSRHWLSAVLAVGMACWPLSASGQPQKTGSWVDPDKSEPAGMKYQTFTSNTINAEVSYLIYLPPGYDKDKERRYPVVYWLHGRGGNQRGCGTIVRKLDAAIRGAQSPAMIVVGVNGLPYSSYVDSKDGKTPVQSVIVKDLIPHIDSTYRTIAKREGRAIEGFSMGGAGAPKIAFKYPELFGAVSILAGALHDLESYKARGTAFQDIYGGKDEYFQANSPWELMEKNADAVRDKTHIRILVGDKDGLLERNQNYAKLLEKLKIPHQFEVVKGVAHSAGPIYDGLGERAFSFYTKAFAEMGKFLPSPSPKEPAKEPSADKTPSQTEESELNWQSFTVKAEDDVKTPAFWAAPAGKGPFPVVVFFHGAPGGIGAEGLRKLADATRWKEFLRAGYLVCVADYRGHPQGKPFEALKGKVNASDDAVAVVRHLKSLPQVDAKRVCVMGGSLGGAVTLEALAQEDAACAVVNAPATFPFLGFRGRPDGKKDRDLSDEEIDKKGALARIDKIKCPVLIVQGTADGLTPLNKKLASLMKEAKKEVRLELFEGEGHGFTNGPETDAYRKALRLTLDFVGQHTTGKKDEKKFIALFDGKTLDGWEVRGGKAPYKVEDGAIVGTTAEGSPNTFLCTKKEYGDFELVFEVKCDKELNSGVQIRSHAYEKDTTLPGEKRPRPAGAVYGYQCEIAPGTATSGNFWDEARHKKWLDDFSKKPDAQKAFKDGEWNQYRIVAQGDRIRSWVNGVACADSRDKEDTSGFIGLQVHSVKPGTGPYQVRWKNLKFRELKPDEQIDP